MLSAFLAVGVIGVNVQQEPLFPRLFPNPTGNNALEYYVRAGDYATANGLTMWQPPYDDSGKYDDRLKFEESMLRGTRIVLDLVKVGNQRPFTLPENELSFSAFANLKLIAKLAMQYSRVQFARGRPDDATEALLLVLEMSDQLKESGGILPYLVAVATDSIALAGFNSAYTSITLNGSDEILNRVALKDASGLAGIWERDIAYVDRSAANDVLGYDADDWAAQRSIAVALSQTLAEYFSRDEKYWMQSSAELSSEITRGEFEYSLFPDVTAAQNFVRVAVRNRTMLRLLRVHAHIAKFRWEEGALPPSLGELPEEAHLDPAADQPYVFLKFTEASYDAYSPGNKYSGVIRLKVRRSDLVNGNPGPP